ncbi:MAG: hypothetical protein NVSMB48_21330 [Marmoricola sp.]
MSTSVALPALGESVTEGTVTRWLKEIGDTVAVDEPLLEVSTDKVDTEIPSPVAGTLLEIKVNTDETVEVGTILAVIGAAEEAASASDEAPAAPAEEAPTPEPEPAPATGEPTTEAAPESTPEPAPAAQELGSPASGTSVTLPALGESVTEGTVTRWLKNVGDAVAVDEPLLEVSTDKVDTEIPSPVAGTLLEIKVNTDETVEVGTELAVIGSGTAATSAPPAAPTPAAPPAPPAPPAAPAATPAPEPTPAAAASAPAASSDDGPAYVTPLVRKMAAENGVDLASITGTGVGGRIRKQDVLAAAAAKVAPAPAAAPTASAPAASTGAPSPLRGTTEKISRLRKVIAERMTESLQTSAQLTQVFEVDVTTIARLREEKKADFLAREGVKLTFLPFFAKAAIDALKVHPKLNANLNTEAGEVTYFDTENIAFAVDTERGLLTPVIKAAGDLSVAGLAKKIADVAERTRTNKITPDDLSGGTFTITNLGSFGALFDTPIINQPQVAILGPGAVIKRPVVIDDPNLGETIAVRHMVHIALTYDHRLVDGADAGRFLQDVKKRLEAGQFEV